MTITWFPIQLIMFELCWHPDLSFLSFAKTKTKSKPKFKTKSFVLIQIEYGPKLLWYLFRWLKSEICCWRFIRFWCVAMIWRTWWNCFCWSTPAASFRFSYCYRWKTTMTIYLIGCLGTSLTPQHLFQRRCVRLQHNGDKMGDDKKMAVETLRFVQLDGEEDSVVMVVVTINAIKRRDYCTAWFSWHDDWWDLYPTCLSTRALSR